MASELSEFVSREYGLDKNTFAIAVCGLRELSEHEDECCVMLELIEPLPAAAISADCSAVVIPEGPGSTSLIASPPSKVDSTVDHTKATIDLVRKLEDTFVSAASRAVSKGAKVSLQF